MLAIPLKTTSRTDIQTPLSNYLNNSPTLPHPSQCRDGLMRISALRNCLALSICTRDAHKHAIAEHALRDASEYHAGLLELEKVGFPILEGKIAGLSLEWECGFRKEETKTIRTNFVYERACLLFNIAALESHLASESDHSTKDGLKASIAKYNTAAGLFLHIRNEVIGLDPNPSTDLTSVCLEMCETVMLAQAQSCIYDMASLSPTPNHSLLAKLAVATSDFYLEGFKLCQASILTRMTECETWTSHLQTKCLLFKALGEYHQGVEDRAKRRYGAEIARLILSMEYCDKAAEYGEKCEIGRMEIDALKRMMLQRKLVAERENNEVFKDAVPSSRHLETIRGHRMAKPLPLPDALTTLNVPLFTDLSLRPRYM